MNSGDQERSRGAGLERDAVRAAPGGIDPREHLAVALDVPDARGALRLVDQLDGRCVWLKVGMELFYAEGSALVRELRARGYRIFLDLKLHDIPNTVASAVRAVSRLDVQLLTVHAVGGPVMLEAAVVMAESLTDAPVLAGVTVLTSMDEAQLNAIGVTGPAEMQVVRLARMAWKAGLRALVASPLELAALRAELGPAPMLIVPGIRAAGAAGDDQRRTSTPRQAIAEGASLLVVGRPITRAPDPGAVAEAMLEEIATALGQARADSQMV